MGTLTAGVAIAALCAGGPPTIERMRSPLWAGAERLLVRCTAAPSVARILGPDWCALALDEARRDARMPVRADAGNRTDRSALILDIGAERDALTIRITRALTIDESEGGLIRHWPALPSASAGDPRVRAALATALDATLPWRRSASAPLRSRRPS